MSDEINNTERKVCNWIFIIICSGVFLYYSYLILSGDITFATRDFHAKTPSGISFSVDSIPINLAGIGSRVLFFGGGGSLFAIGIYLSISDWLRRRRGKNNDIKE